MKNIVYLIENIKYGIVYISPIILLLEYYRRYEKYEGGEKRIKLLEIAQVILLVLAINIFIEKDYISIMPVAGLLYFSFFKEY